MLVIDNKNCFFADLHIHSRFSRACSKNLNLENLEKWALIKGLDLLGTGDFTHPEWLKELKENLFDEEEKGIFHSKTGFRFILTGEVSLMYTQEKGRRVHLLVLAPSFEVVDKINFFLDSLGRRDYDGRPIFNISCEEFAKRIYELSSDIEIIPPHCWTPWFGIFGSESGFDSLEEAFLTQKEKIHAIETGLSSDPEMNLRLSELQDKTILSFSDSHSFWPWRLGREASIFSSINSYKEILNEIRENKIIGTIEVNPAYGKYHYDGHRACNFSCSPKEAERLKNICPVCKRELLLGVEHRVEELAELSEEHANKKARHKKIYKVLPLHEIISLAISSGISSKKTWSIYYELIKKFGNELNILLNAPKEKLVRASNEKLAGLIIENREGKIKVKPGYDGVYGVAVIEEKQGKLF